MTFAPPPSLPPQRPHALEYAGAPQPRWSAVPVTVAVGLYGAVLSLTALVMDSRMRQIFSDFKIDLPLVSELLLTISHWVMEFYLWLPLMIAMVVAPALIVPNVPVPVTPQSRRRVARTTRTIILLVYFATLVVLILAVFMPMISLLHSVAGPQKR